MTIKKVTPQTHELFTIPDWNMYFMSIAHVVKTRGNCLLLQVGAVIVQGRRIIATGYNGTPAKVENCLEGGCKRCRDKFEGRIASGERKGSCLCVHAETNAILQSALHGTATSGGSLYTTHSPCMLCAKEILNSGITSVYYSIVDNSERVSIELLKKHLGAKRVRHISN